MNNPTKLTAAERSAFISLFETRACILVILAGELTTEAEAPALTVLGGQNAPGYDTGGCLSNIALDDAAVRAEVVHQLGALRDSLEAEGLA